MTEGPIESPVELLDPNAIFQAVRETSAFQHPDRHVILLRYLVLLQDLQGIFAAESATEGPKSSLPGREEATVCKTCQCQAQDDEFQARILADLARHLAVASQGS